LFGKVNPGFSFKNPPIKEKEGTVDEALDTMLVLCFSLVIVVLSLFGILKSVSCLDS